MPDPKLLLDALLYCVLPAIAAALLCAGVGGRRCIGLAAGASVFAAWSTLKTTLPEWPHQLWSGNNDGTQWWLWSVLACGLAAAVVGDRRPPPWLRHALGALLLAGMVWLMLTNRRARMGAGEAWLEHAVAIALLVLVWLGMRRTAERRDGVLLAVLWCGCFTADSLLLLHGHAGLLAQLAGALVAALATAAGTALWRRPFHIGAPAVLALAAAHGGLLIAGRHFAYLPPECAVLGGLAPAALWVAGSSGLGGGGSGRAHARLAFGVLLAIGLLAVAFWRAPAAM